MFTTNDQISIVYIKINIIVMRYNVLIHFLFRISYDKLNVNTLVSSLKFVSSSHTSGHACLQHNTFLWDIVNLHKPVLLLIYEFIICFYISVNRNDGDIQILIWQF
jgi:hypothetical protein